MEMSYVSLFTFFFSLSLIFTLVVVSIFSPPLQNLMLLALLSLFLCLSLSQYSKFVSPGSATETNSRKLDLVWGKQLKIFCLTSYQKGSRTDILPAVSILAPTNLRSDFDCYWSAWASFLTCNRKEQIKIGFLSDRKFQLTKIQQPIRYELVEELESLIIPFFYRKIKFSRTSV